MSQFYHEEITPEYLDFRKRKKVLPVSLSEAREYVKLLQQKSPETSYKELRQAFGVKFSDEAFEEIELMEEEREKVIQFEIKFNKQKCKKLNRTIPEQFYTGKTLRVFFPPEVYNSFHFFKIFHDLSWYSYEEEAMLVEESTIADF